MPQELLEHASNPLFERTERALERTRWWDAFKEEVDIAQIDQSPIELVFLSLAGGIFVGLILYAITGSVLAGLPALIAGPVVVRVVVRQLLRRQQSRFAEQLGEHLQEVASAMRAGRSLVDAFALVGAEASEPTRREFERALSDERLGVPLDEALLPIVERMDNDDMSQVALVAALDRTTGASTAEVLDRVAEGIRENTELQRELRTLTAQVRMSRWILTALPIAILVLISLDDPSYEYPMYHTTFGVVLLILCGLMLAAGSFVMSRLVRIEL
jgi:tight adherence protein B